MIVCVLYQNNNKEIHSVWKRIVFFQIEYILWFQILSKCEPATKQKNKNKIGLGNCILWNAYSGHSISCPLFIFHIHKISASITMHIFPLWLTPKHTWVASSQNRHSHCYQKKPELRIWMMSMWWNWLNNKTSFEMQLDLSVSIQLKVVKRLNHFFE